MFVPFNSLKITDILYAENNSNTNPGAFTLTFPEDGEYIVICRISGTTSIISTTCEFSNPNNITEEVFFDTGNYYYERIVKYNATANDTISVSAELGGGKKRSVMALRLG